MKRERSILSGHKKPNHFLFWQNHSSPFQEGRGRLSQEWASTASPWPLLCAPRCSPNWGERGGLPLAVSSGTSAVHSPVPQPVVHPLGTTVQSTCLSFHFFAGGGGVCLMSEFDRHCCSGIHTIELGLILMVQGNAHRVWHQTHWGHCWALSPLAGPSSSMTSPL